MVRMIHPSVFLTDRIYKLRYIAFGFLLFDLAYGCILVYLFDTIRYNIFSYYTLSVLYVCAILSAMFGIKDKVVLLFYPILVFAIPVAIFCIFFITSDLVQIFVCSKHSNNSTLSINMPLVDSSCYVEPKVVIKERSVSMFIEVVILVDKILEFFIIRRLMTLLALVKATSTLNFVRRSVQMVPSDVEQIHGKGRLEKTISQLHDTDDDMVVYQSHSKKGSSENLAQSTSGYVSTPPPAYREKTTTPGQHSEDILPIKKQSKHAIE